VRMRILDATEVKSQSEPSPALVKLARKWAKAWQGFCESHSVPVDVDADTLRNLRTTLPDGREVPALPGLFLAFEKEDVDVIQSEAGNGSDRFALAFCREVGTPEGWRPSDRAVEDAAATVRYNYTGRKGEQKGQKVTLTFSGLHRVTPQKGGDSQK
jgi:hypothetical protein